MKGSSKRKKLREFSGSPSVPNVVLGNGRVWEAIRESGVRGGARYPLLGLDRQRCLRPQSLFLSEHARWGQKYYSLLKRLWHYQTK